MQLRAHETVYWPGINKDISKQYQSCKTYVKHSKSQRCEHLQSHPTPELPWHTDRNIWTPAEIIQCPTYDGRSYRLKTIHSGVYTRNRRFIKPDLTAAEAPVTKQVSEPNISRPTRTIQKPDRFIESK